MSPSALAALPPEVIGYILLAAVKARELKRALRLRYVSKSWSVAVLEAIFASGMLDDEPRLKTSVSFCRSRYLAYRILGRRHSWPLRIVRMVAERIVRHQSPDGRTCGDEELRACVRELCDVPHLGLNYNCSREREDWFTECPVERIKEDDMQYQQALLAAAAWMNDISLVKETLPRFRDCLYLISHDGFGGEHHFERLFGSPVQMAAFRGNNEVLQVLIEALSPSARRHRHVGDILEFGAMGNQMSTVDLVLEPSYNSHNPSLVAGLQKTTSLAMFKKLLPLARDHLEMEFRQTSRTFTEKFLPLQLVHAVKSGDVAMVAYVSELGARPSASWFRSPYNTNDPVFAAARCGHEEALKYLIDKGFVFTQESLQATIQHGHRETVREGLRLAGDGDYSLAEPLRIAVEKEDETVVRMLYKLDAPRLSAEDKAQALRKSRELGLESMTRLLQGLET